MVVIELLICYAVGTLFGFWVSRSYWMTRGASNLYDLLRKKGRLIHHGD